MAHRYFFIGRAERIVIAVLLALAATSMLLYILIVRPQEAEAAHEASALMASGDSIFVSPDYVGPPTSMRQAAIRKFDKRVVLDLNTADSVTLMRVPGIGSAFAHRILELRRRLGGYYTVLQLQEVYGMDEEKYLALRGWFAIRTAPRTYPLDSLRPHELPRHPYLSYAQSKAINRLLYRHERITSWSMLMNSEAFSHDDSVRLAHYFVEPRKVSTR